jgi:hypothetical protein
MHGGGRIYRRHLLIEGSQVLPFVKFHKTGPMYYNVEPLRSGPCEIHSNQVPSTPPVCRCSACRANPSDTAFPSPAIHLFPVSRRKRTVWEPCLQKGTRCLSGEEMHSGSDGTAEVDDKIRHADRDLRLIPLSRSRDVLYHQ